MLIVPFVEPKLNLISGIIPNKEPLEDKIEMIKRFIPAYLFFTCLLILQISTANAQMTMADYLRQKFERYCAEVPREEVYINTDRHEYIAGENMWFNVYLFDRQRQELSDRSRIVYLELLNPENRPVIQTRIGVYNGTGPGQVAIPDTLTTGTYILRAYTSWMKNFLPVNCFVRKIRIWNALSSRKFEAGELITDAGTENNRSLLASVSADKNISIELQSPDHGVLPVSVISKHQYREVNNNLVYIFIQTHGKVNYISTELLRGDTTVIPVPSENMLPGINQVTLFNLKGQPVCESYMYTPAYKAEAISVDVPDSTGCRDKVSVDIHLNGMTTGQDSSALSISVAPVTGYDNAGNIKNYMVLGTEFGIIDPRSYLDNNGNILQEKMDRLLVRMHSNWIDWNRIISFSKPDFKYPFEKEFHYISGTLIGGGKNNNVSDKYIFLSNPGETATFKYALTDDSGNFSFGLHIDESLKDLIMQPEYNIPGQNIKIDSPFSDVYLATETGKDTSDVLLPSYISEWGASYQVRQIYSIRTKGVPLPPKISPLIPLRFYGKPDIEIKLADYIKLPVMQEVFFELVTGVFLKEKNSTWEITIADPENNIIYTHPPVLMIDGVIIKDASVIAGLDPELVDRIDVVREEYMVGDYLFYGIVNIITHAGDFSNGTLPDEALRYPYRVLEPVSAFESPDYSSPEEKTSRIPDFRTTLYWNPSVITDKNGKARISFRTSDLTSDYKISIQGVTPDGKPVSIRKTLKVRK